MRTYKKPLGRSIAFGCILFTAILCLTLSVLNYYNQRDALYRRYESHITDILRFVENNFIVILRGQDYDNIDALAERFCAQANGGVDAAEPWKQVSASIGVALYDKTVDKSVEDVLKRADQAMYEKKKDMKAVRL